MWKRCKQFVRRSDAATAVEYAIMLALILLVVLSAVILLGQKTNTSFSNSSNSITSAFGS